MTATPSPAPAPSYTLYELRFDHDPEFFAGPNGWKVHLSLLHKQLPYKVEMVNYIELRSTVRDRHPVAAGGPPRITSPALEISSAGGGGGDGDHPSLLCDSFRIAEYLEASHPDRPSLFSGTSSSSSDAAAVRIGKAYARLVDLGLGNSDPQWGVWFDLIFPDLQARLDAGANRDYFVSDARLGPGGYAALMARPGREDLVARARASLAPVRTALAERPGEFLQGAAPGFADFVLFGRYAMVRNSNPALAKLVFEDVGEEIRAWVNGIVERYPQIQKHLRPMP
ncbi:hypothetical protein DFJ73DRAFT_793435 [Zopfochytrium polystomum]|nr:hypothetical protein DFJ73DRAFT_793435 [Zopfochytrium polystomum]